MIFIYLFWTKMNLFAFLPVLYICTVYFVSSEDTTEYAPIVQLDSGSVRGIVQFVDGYKLNFYQGIPFGEAVRFSKPKPVSPWIGLYNATASKDSCPQPLTDPLISVIQGTTHSENCLYLNAWVPVQNHTNGLLPVMFWIHGGAFTFGSIFSFSNDLRYLASQGDVIAISANYRLGPFGFLYGGNDEAPGNLGLHDVILALKWVQTNIKAFGGDPNQITVFGESAGSSMLGSLILSPLAKGLFHRAIMQSAAPNSGYRSPSQALQMTKDFGKLLNCKQEEPTQLVACLRSKPMEAIVNATKIDFSNGNFQPMFGDQVLPIKPQEALKLGKVNKEIDVLYGVNDREGSYFVEKIFPSYLSSDSNITLQSAANDISHVMQLFGLSFGSEVAQFYLSGLPKNASQDELKIAVSNALGDHRITCPTILFAEYYAKASPNSLFFSYRLMQHFQLLTTPAWSGVAHAEDLPYLFMVPFLAKPEDKELSFHMRNSWASFARKGNPGSIKTHNWTVALNSTNSNTSFMSLHEHHYKMVNDFYVKTCQAFWKAKLFS